MNNSKPWHLLNKNIEKSKSDVFSQRINICSECEILFKPTFQCLACGCFMKLKAKIKDATCPLNKW